MSAGVVRSVYRLYHQRLAPFGRHDDADRRPARRATRAEIRRCRSELLGQLSLVCQPLFADTATPDRRCGAVRPT